MASRQTWFLRLRKHLTDTYLHSSGFSHGAPSTPSCFPNNHPPPRCRCLGGANRSRPDSFSAHSGPSLSKSFPENDKNHVSPMWPLCTSSASTLVRVLGRLQGPPHRLPVSTLIFAVKGTLSKYEARSRFPLLRTPLERKILQIVSLVRDLYGAYVKNTPMTQQEKGK